MKSAVRVPPSRLAPVRLAMIWVASYVLTVLLYTPYLGAPYFSDDFALYFTSPPPHLYEYLWMPGAFSHLYRPLEAMILTVIQQRFGFNTTPIHLISFAAHASLCTMVYAVSFRIGLGGLVAGCSALLMLVSQLGGPALLGNDTMSQAMSAALAAASVLIVAVAWLDRSTNRMLVFVKSALCFFLALLFKETAIGSGAIIALLIVKLSMLEKSRAAQVKTALVRLLPFGVLGAIYLGLRFNAGRHLSSEAIYRVSFGVNVLKNLAQDVVAALTPVSSITAAVAVMSRNLPVIALVAAAVLIVAASTAAGLRRANLALCSFLAFSFVCSMFPSILLQHTSELYVYNAQPYVALLLAMALVSLWESGAASRILAAACLILMVAGNIAAAREKARWMDANGKAAQALLARIGPRVMSMPPDSFVLLAETNPNPIKYSVYVLHGLDVLEFGDQHLGAILGRPDVKIQVVSREIAGKTAQDSHHLVLLF